jgi:hypothetical protein
MQERGDVPLSQKGVAMNERQWELYRLSVVETRAESPYKRAVSAAIEHKLTVLGLHIADQSARAMAGVQRSPALNKY